MKRKILIVFLGIFVFVCLFAMSVFATVNYEETATLADGTILPIYDENHNPLIWYVSGTDASGNNVYSSVPNNRNEPNAANDTYVTYVSSTGTWAQLNDIYIHTYNEETGEYISTIDDNLQIVVLNLREFDMIYLGGINANYIQYMYYPATLKDCPEKFKGKTALRLVDMSVCVNLVGGFGGTQNFSGCTNLHTVRLPIGPSYTLEGGNNYKFKGAAISYIVIPEAVRSIGTDNFRDCKNLENVYILGNTSLGERNFAGCANLTNIYFLGDDPTIDLTSFEKNFIECIDDRNIYYDFRSTGKYFFFATTNAEYLNSVKETIEATAIVAYKDFVASPSSYTEGRYIISGTNVCDVYYGEHEIDEEASNSCAGICSVCGSAIMVENPVHNYDIVIEYSNYLENGRKIHTCQNSNCIHNETPYVTNTKPLFICLGYSAPENGDGGISIRYSVNSLAIEEYTKSTGIELSYGLFATTKLAIGNSDIFDDNGDTVNGAIALDVTESNFAFISLKMVGFDTEDSKKTEFAIGAYVATTENGQKNYSYLQQGTPADGEKYAYIKYNDFVSTNI